jgi:hypothetical protein
VILELSGIVEDPYRLEEDEEHFKRIQEDVRSECTRFGRVKSMHIPLPNAVERALENKEKLFEKHFIQGTSKTKKKNLFKKSALVKTLFLQTDHSLTNVQDKAITQLLSVTPSDKCISKMPAPITPSVTYEKTKLLCPSASIKSPNEQGVGLGKVFIEFTRPDIARMAACNFCTRTFEGRPVTVQFYSLKLYQKNFKKGLVPVTKDEIIQLALDTQEKLMLSQSKLFLEAELR